MIRAYLCWSDREPEFQELLPGSHLLISPALLAKRWTVRSWRTLPESLMVDSGAFTQSKRKGIVDVRTCLEAQLRILKGWPPEREAILVHYDKPLHPNLPFDEYQDRVSQNLDAAGEYIGAFPKGGGLIPMAVLHALDEETLASSHLELRSMGYRRFALGSLVALIYRSRLRLQGLLRTCRDMGLTGLHILGISSPSLLKPEIGPWIGSFDTSAPVRQAIGGTVFYSDPFERFVIRPTGPQKLSKRSYGCRSELDFPRPCACPVCSVDARALLGPCEADARQKRKVHNAFHLLREVRSWSI
jgi:queuine/archaeosine tRNA-ribosyltransferase